MMVLSLSTLPLLHTSCVQAAACGGDGDGPEGQEADRRGPLRQLQPPSPSWDWNELLPLAVQCLEHSTGRSIAARDHCPGHPHLVEHPRPL